MRITSAAIGVWRSAARCPARVQEWFRSVADARRRLRRARRGGGGRPGRRRRPAAPALPRRASARRCGTRARAGPSSASPSRTAAPTSTARRWRAVAVSFRHCLEVMRPRAAPLREVIAVNGGARSALWRQILCDALGVPLAYLPAGAGRPRRRRAARRHGGGPAPGRGGGAALARRLVRHEPDRGAHRDVRDAAGRAARSSIRRLRRAA